MKKGRDAHGDRRDAGSRHALASVIAASLLAIGSGAAAHEIPCGRADLDRDGIQNRVDRDLDGDGILNRRDGDRDGDGIVNGRDAQPDRPNVRHAGRRGPDGDLDRDGIRNRTDPDRDGDGLRNRRDPHPRAPKRG